MNSSTLSTNVDSQLPTSLDIENGPTAGSQHISSTKGMCICLTSNRLSMSLSNCLCVPKLEKVVLRLVIQPLPIPMECFWMWMSSLLTMLLLLARISAVTSMSSSIRQCLKQSMERWRSIAHVDSACKFWHELKCLLSLSIFYFLGPRRPSLMKLQLYDVI